MKQRTFLIESFKNCCVNIVKKNPGFPKSISDQVCNPNQNKALIKKIRENYSLSVFKMQLVQQSLNDHQLETFSLM